MKRGDNMENNKVWQPKELTEIVRVEAVKCVKCHKMFLIDDDKYLVFYGNVVVGTGGGLVGDNLDKDGKVIKVTVVCRTVACVSKILSLE